MGLCPIPIMDRTKKGEVPQTQVSFQLFIHYVLSLCCGNLKRPRSPCQLENKTLTSCSQMAAAFETTYQLNALVMF